MARKRRYMALLALALVVCMLAACLLAGCGSKSEGEGDGSADSNSNSNGNGNGNGSNDDFQETTEEVSETRDIKVGEEFTVELESNPTTGYQWSMTTRPDQAVLGLTTDSYTAPETDMVGVPGMHVYRFLGVGPGQTTVVLEYSRSFEPDAPPAKTHTIKVTVS